MRNGPRVMALVGAPLLVVAVTAIVMVSRSDAGVAPVSPDGPKVTIIEPAQGSVLPMQSVQVLARAEGPDGVAAAELRVDDKRVGNQMTGGGSSADLQFLWTPADPGDYTLRVRARENDGKWGEAVVTISAGTDLPPLPPPPTTSPSTTPTPVTTPATSLAPLAPLAPLTTPTPAPATVVPTVRPTNPPTTTSPTTLAPTSVPTTTELPTTTTTVAVTDPTTTTSPVTTQGRCRLDPPDLLAPASRSTLQAQQPTFLWSSTGSCPPASQVLVITSLAGIAEVRLDGVTRAYVPPQPLPACSLVRWEVVVYGASGRPRASHWSDFSTFGC